VVDVELSVGTNLRGPVVLGSALMAMPTMVDTIALLIAQPAQSTTEASVISRSAITTSDQSATSVVNLEVRLEVGWGPLDDKVLEVDDAAADPAVTEGSALESVEQAVDPGSMDLTSHIAISSSTISGERRPPGGDGRDLPAVAVWRRASTGRWEATTEQRAAGGERRSLGREGRAPVAGRRDASA
ncbi:hypothetical protein ABZP36_008252, partial [Zizania latifolia]